MARRLAIRRTAGASRFDRRMARVDLDEADATEAGSMEAGKGDVMIDLWDGMDRNSIAACLYCVP